MPTVPTLWPTVRWVQVVARLVCRRYGHDIVRSLRQLSCVRCGERVERV